jgi:hypothetical protein
LTGCVAAIVVERSGRGRGGEKEGRGSKGR